MGRKAIPSDGYRYWLPSCSLARLILAAFTLAAGLALAPLAHAANPILLDEGLEWVYSHNGTDRCFADGYQGETRKVGIEAPVDQSATVRYAGLTVSYYPSPRHREHHGASRPGKYDGDEPRRLRPYTQKTYVYDFDVYIVKARKLTDVVDRWTWPISRRGLTVTVDDWYGPPKAIELAPFVKDHLASGGVPLRLQLAYWAQDKDGGGWNHPGAKRDRMIQIPIWSIWLASHNVLICARDDSVLPLP